MSLTANTRVMVMDYIIVKHQQTVFPAQGIDIKQSAFFVKDVADVTDCLSSFSQSSGVFGLCISWAKKKS